MVASLVVVPTLVHPLMVWVGLLIVASVNRVLATLTVQLGIARHVIEHFVFMSNSLTSRHNESVL